MALFDALEIYRELERPIGEPSPNLINPLDGSGNPGISHELLLDDVWEALSNGFDPKIGYSDDYIQSWKKHSELVIGFWHRKAALYRQMIASERPIKQFGDYVESPSESNLDTVLHGMFVDEGPSLRVAHLTRQSPFSTDQVSIGRDILGISTQFPLTIHSRVKRDPDDAEYSHQYRVTFLGNRISHMESGVMVPHIQRKQNPLIVTRNLNLWPLAVNPANL